MSTLALLTSCDRPDDQRAAIDAALVEAMSLAPTTSPRPKMRPW